MVTFQIIQLPLGEILAHGLRDGSHTYRLLYTCNVSVRHREEFTKELEAFVKAIRPDDQDFTTIEHIWDGLAAHGGKLEKNGIHATEWVRRGCLNGDDDCKCMLQYRVCTLRLNALC